MDFTVFYAWQSDTDERVNRYFIRDAIELALKNLRRDAKVLDAPRLDHDTKNVPGTPDVFATLLRKIETAGVFLADITYVAAVPGDTTPLKHVPNPNVMIELGYALAKITDRRIITVMNTVFGSPEDLPFDLAKHRWPICYELKPSSKPTATERQELAKSIAQAIRDILASGPVTNVDAALRARIRTILLDADHEVPRLMLWSAEQVLHADPAARGIFSLAKDLAAPTAACASNDETGAVTELLAAYRPFRAAASELDTYAADFVGRQLPDNNFLRYWQIIAGYCVQRSAGWTEDEALRVSKLQNVGHDGKECLRIYPLLSSDDGFRSRLANAQHRAARVEAATTALRHAGFEPIVGSS
jgi:hypothetical protein